MVMNKLYGGIAVTLNNWENHRTETEYEDHLISKVFLFQTVNSFSSLVFIAFIKGSFKMLGKDTACANGSCMGELATQLSSIFVTQIIVNNVRRRTLAAQRPAFTVCFTDFGSGGAAYQDVAQV